MSDTFPTLAHSDDPAADRSAIFDRLLAFNLSRHGESEHRPFTLVLRDAEGATVGGAYGASSYRWAFVEILFVPEALRGLGHGRRLIAEIERLARERKCLGVRLDTFGFQAPGFYRRLGYEVFGTIEDHPPGAGRVFLLKRFG